MPRFGYLLPTRGVVVSNDGETTLGERIEADVIDLARRVEDAGFESAWVGDSVLAKPRLEPLSTVAAVSRETDDLELGTAVYLPTLRHPVHVAHLTATVDQLSGGRLGLGVGVGVGPAVKAEYETVGLDFGTRGARMDELLAVVTALWEGEPVDYDGEFFQLEDASIGFTPARAPPIYVPTAAFGSGGAIPVPIRDRIVTYGDGWLPIATSPETYEYGRDRIGSLLAEADRDPDAFDFAYYFDAVIDEDAEAALEEARTFYERYYPSWDRLSDEEIRERGAFGPAEAVASRLDDYARAGVETVVVRFTARDQQRQLRRFVDAVL